MSNEPTLDNLPLNEEALPQIDESELVFGAKLAPYWEGTYAVRSKLGKRGKVYDKNKGSYSIHVENQIIKPLKVKDPNPPDNPGDPDKVFFDDKGNGRSIHDFFRISASNMMGIQKAVQFLKYAGDPDYNKYKTVGELATAVEEALRQEPDQLKLAGRWEAQLKVGVDPDTNKDKYESVRGIRNFPDKQDGGKSHIALIDGEEVPAQFAVTEYGEVTAKDLK